ncbi:MAG TPA: class I SAM-dependent methyltransferase [Candidatus Methylomirabilis sp.]|nr:class I SAM-dependent methyltransferase [Candidatus Methylomirabilis sp.]
MPANASEWDARHREAAEKALEEPANIVLEWLPLLPEGPALDLACGRGRHTLLLAAHGHAVTAVDWSEAALEILEAQAHAKKLEVGRPVVLGSAGVAAAYQRGIHPVQANLEDIRLPDSAFAVIVCVQYLQRPLFPQMERALRPGGVLLFETFTHAQLEYSGGPRNPAYLLEPEELRTAFPRLEVLFYRELNAGQGIASLVGRRPMSVNRDANCAAPSDRAL